MHEQKLFKTIHFLYLDYLRVQIKMNGVDRPQEGHHKVPPNIIFSRFSLQNFHTQLWLGFEFCLKFCQVRIRQVLKEIKTHLIGLGLMDSPHTNNFRLVSSKYGLMALYPETPLKSTNKFCIYTPIKLMSQKIEDVIS